MKKVILLSTVFASLVFAGVKSSSSYDKCMDKAGNNLETRECIYKETQGQEVKLTKAYKNAMKVLEPKKQTELRDVQRLWISFRKAKCAFYYGITGGTIESINSSSCFLDMTTERVEEIEWIVEIVQDSL